MPVGIYQHAKGFNSHNWKTGKHGMRSLKTTKEFKGGAIMRFIKTDSREFNRRLAFSERLEFLTIYTEEELDKADLYIATGGGVGFAISPDKELFNLFNNTGTKLCGREAVDYAITKGARKVSCFNGFLRKYYERWGFRVVKRESWNEDLAPLGWDYDRYGKPDVVWLELPTNFHE